MIMKPSMLIMPSGMISVPSSLVAMRNLTTALWLPPPCPKSVFTTPRVSTQSWRWLGSTSKSALNMNQKPEKMRRYVHTWGFTSSTIDSRQRLACSAPRAFSSRCFSSRSAFPGSL